MGGFWLGGFCPGGFCPGGFCPGGFCPRTEYFAPDFRMSQLLTVSFSTCLQHSDGLSNNLTCTSIFSFRNVLNVSTVMKNIP